MTKPDAPIIIRRLAAAIDALTSPTLKHLREAWWDDVFTEFLAETLKPRPGNRILDVGCGEGLAEVAIGRLHISQVRLVGVDLVLSKVSRRVRKRPHTISGSSSRPPMPAGCRFATACSTRIYLRRRPSARQRRRKRRRRVGRVSPRRAGACLAVEPDNSARYGFSSTPAGRRAFELSRSFFNALSGAQSDGRTSAIGPNLPRLFSERGLEPIDVRLFPVSQTLARTARCRASGRRDEASSSGRSHSGASDAARWLGRDYLDTLTAYEAEATRAGSSFVEIQHTMLFATVGQKVD